ncbi:hypothetical protein DY000_02038398 [Brassica cretica]|uniref:Uncharacterized protein n=1 Tax=Brassica cretica TaxID=69181 RepID=A0ABQ7BB68_BRACR|nr:hypothetical protein DY000_02038398 [Brassica cretica]
MGSSPPPGVEPGNMIIGSQSPYQTSYLIPYWFLAWDFYPRSGFDPRFDPDPIRKSGYPEGPNPDPDSKMLDPSKPDPDPDILIFKSGYPDP